SASIGAELDVGRAVETAASVEKCLIAGGVASETLDLQNQPLAAAVLVPLVVLSTRFLAEIDQLDLVPHFRCRLRGVGGREPEVALQRVERRTGQDGSADKRLGNEVDSRERRIGRLDCQGRRDRLRRKGKHVAYRDVLTANQSEARRSAAARRIRRIEYAQIIARTPDRIEYGLARRQESESVGPPMVVGRAV